RLAGDLGDFSDEALWHRFLAAMLGQWDSVPPARPVSRETVGQKRGGL
ncbi:MAG: hypothetical protein JWQ87_170, partial [Candidatus Sulfotelmatobacter sp.]|nr:hypothetical protein [Candidatus Sulfotelmatobacter sp.]